MRLRSLVPFREPGALMQPDFGLFGLHREIDRLFNEAAQGIGQNGAQLVPKFEISENDRTIEVSAEMPVSSGRNRRVRFFPCADSFYESASRLRPQSLRARLAASALNWQPQQRTTALHA